MVQTEGVPSYGDVEEDTNGNTILTCDFLPNIVNNLPDKWFYLTLEYFLYVDLNQRDGNGNMYMLPQLVTAVPENVDKWKECEKLLGYHTFKETGKLEYCYEIWKMVSVGGYNCRLMYSGGRRGCLDAA